MDESVAQQETSRLVNRVREQLEAETNRTNQSVSTLAAATGVPLENETVERGPVSAVLHQIQERVCSIQAERERATQESLRQLAAATRTTSGEVESSSSTQDLISCIRSNTDRLIKDRHEMQQGLSELLDVAVLRVSSTELIRQAQEKFRSLEALVDESGNEVISLRHRIASLQEEIDRQRDKHQRQDAEDQQKIANYQETVQRLQRQLSTLSDRGNASETELAQCRLELDRRNASLEEAIAASRQTTEALSLREAESRKQLREAEAVLERTEREMKELKTRITDLQQASEDREIDTEKALAQNARQEQACQQRLREKDEQIRVLHQEYDEMTERYRQAIAEGRQAAETLSLREGEWQHQLQQANAESQRTERETNGLRRRIEEIQQLLEEREVVVENLRRENERQDRVSRQQLEDKENMLRVLRQQQIDRLEEETQARENLVSRQVDESEKIALRLERDQLIRKVADLETQGQKQQQNQIDCDRLTALNDQIMAQFEELRDAREVQDNLIAELRSQVATLEATTAERTRLDFEEPRLVEDDAFVFSHSPPTSQGVESNEQRLEELGQLLAEREYELLILDDNLFDRNAKLANLTVDIEDAEATLAELYATIESIRHREAPPDLPPELDLPVDVESPPITPVSLSPPVSLEEWKERFPTVKPCLQAVEAKRWILETGNLDESGLRYDAGLHDSLLDPRMRFVYREQVTVLLRQTIAFVANLGGGGHLERKQRSQMFRGLDNLQRLALRAKRYGCLDGFRMGTVCEFILPLTESIQHQGAVLQRYCELVVEMAMVTSIQWRASTVQQTRRLIFTERDLPSNDPTAVVVRFLGSPFQSFDRCELFKNIVKHLVAPKLGWTIKVPVDGNSSKWSPPEAILRDYDEVTPRFAPTDWIAARLDMASTLVPGLVHVLPGQNIDRMYRDVTYVQIARLAQADDVSEESVLLVGQRDTWIVVDPLWSEESNKELNGDGRRLVGALRAPRGVSHSADRGFALMTWIRDVFVHGTSMDDVQFRGQPDRDRCTLEHYLKCFFHP